MNLNLCNMTCADHEESGPNFTATKIICTIGPACQDVDTLVRGDLAAPVGRRGLELSSSVLTGGYARLGHDLRPL